MYAARRARVIEALRAAGGGVAVLATAPERQRNADNHHPFRHDSSFYYLTGFAEPESWLVLTSTGRSLLFCRPRDAERELWDGYRLGPEAAPAELGVDEAHPIGRLDDEVPPLLNGQAGVWFPFGGTHDVPRRVTQWLDTVRSHERMGWIMPTQQRDLNSLVDEMRLFKDEHEIGLMRRAAQISAEAHARAMRFARPGCREYEVEAELLHEFRRQGASGPAYGSIVAAGRNACVLHYEAGHAQLRDGELCLIDAGCEYGSYASDITRTFPAGGRFSAPQRELYDLVVAAQAAAVAATRPGARKQDAHWAAVRVLSQGLLDEFGPSRIIDTPISETAFIGLAVGAATEGMRPIAELMFADFMGVCLDQIYNHMAKIHYESGGNVTVPMVLTTAVGGGYSDGAQHSQTLWGLFAHLPGMKVVVPSLPADAKGLMTSAIRDDSPVVYMFHKGVMGLPWMAKNPRSIDVVPEGDYTVPIGKANVVRPGSDVSVVTISLSVAGVAQAAPTANKKLTGTVGPGFTITVAKRTVKAGTYNIVIQDRSNAHNWHITGPGVNKKTSVSGTGTITLKNVKLKKGSTYTIVCDPHASIMRGSFTIG